MPAVGEVPETELAAHRQRGQPSIVGGEDRRRGLVVDPVEHEPGAFLSRRGQADPVARSHGQLSRAAESHHGDALRVIVLEEDFPGLHVRDDHPAIFIADREPAAIGRQVEGRRPGTGPLKSGSDGLAVTAAEQDLAI